MITLKWREVYLYRVAIKLNLRLSNLQLMPWNLQIQYSYLLIEIAGKEIDVIVTFSY
jgi:hypothetical protein